jgi:hypothetical protein
MVVIMKNGVFWDVTPCGSPEDAIINVQLYDLKEVENTGLTHVAQDST